MQIPMEVLPLYENAIYLPMLLVILEQDRIVVEMGNLKFKKPYVKVIEKVERHVKEKLKRTNIYFRQHQMRLIKVSSDGRFTEYQFIYKGHQENRRYSNIRLRNRTEELLNEYFAGDFIASNL